MRGTRGAVMQGIGWALYEPMETDGAGAKGISRFDHVLFLFRNR